MDSMASKLQGHGRFKKCEAKLARRREQTKGGVEYKGPSPDEASLTATNKRRRRIKRKLVPHMSKEEKHMATSERVSRPRSEAIELKLQQQCKESLEVFEYIQHSFCPWLASEKYAGKGVEYEGPKPTETQSETDQRRRRLRRRLWTHNIVQQKFGRIREVIISMTEKVKSGLDSKYAKKDKSPQMLARLTAYYKAKKTNSALTKNCEYPGKPVGKHCPCHGKTRGYLTIGRAAAFLNHDWEHFPEEWNEHLQKFQMPRRVQGPPHGLGVVNHG